MPKLFTIILLTVSMMVYAQTPKLYINEFMASNDAGYADEFGDFGDWIEIYNDSDEPVQIGGMYITDDLTSPDTWQIPVAGGDTTVVPAKGYLILWADKESEKGPLHVEIKLSGDGEQIGLSMIGSETVWVDSLTYGAQKTDTTEARIPDAGSYWHNVALGSPQTNNLSQYDLKLYINEFMASNDTSYTDEFGDFGDWIEIYNAEEFDVNLRNLYISDDLTDPGTWQIPDGMDTTTVPAGNFLILWADKESEKGPNHVEIKLSGDGEQIGLSWKGETDFNWIDSLTYTAQIADVSEGRLPDASDAWANFVVASPGATNESGVVVGIGNEEIGFPGSMVLEQNYPNPFNPSTTINYFLPQAGTINISVFNVVGQKVATLLDGKQSAGNKSMIWNANGFASGIYFISLKMDGKIQTRKMILAK